MALKTPLEPFAIFQPEASCATRHSMIRFLVPKVCLLCCFLAMNTASRVWAQSQPVIDPVLNQAQLAMDDAEYEKALNWIEQGLKRSDISIETLEKLYWMEGTCYISLEMPQKAVTSFQKLLAVSPGYSPDPMSPPKLLRVFQEAQTQHNSNQDIKINLQPRSATIAPQKAMNAVAMRLVVDGTHNQHVIKHVLLHVIVPGERNAITLDALPTDDNKQTFWPPFQKNYSKKRPSRIHSSTTGKL